MPFGTLIIIAVLGAVAYFMYKSGFFSSLGQSVSGDRYTQYAQAAAGLANNATGNFLSVHNGISQGINDQVNRSVDTAIGSITGWVQQAQNNRNANDQREYEQFMGILSTI